MNIKIRQATMGDLDSITTIESICFPKEEAATRESIMKRIETFHENFYVAEMEGKLIGFINGCVINEETIRDELFENAALHNRDGKYQTIFGLDVLPEYRRQGIAAQLMNHMIGEAKKAGRSGVILTCKERLMPYYSKFGFINKGISESLHGGALWYDMMLYINTK